ncbi:trichohyalin [Astyanax mexicanus]|uniref:trichohyalin n=1 Tax=Astyanax mexicanus TaxID=7994 RepID=UPI0020CB2CDD|nr:trichohyalin [Astyanax mexicanus]
MSAPARTRRSDLNSLEKMVNKTTLTTQRVLHTHIMAPDSPTVQLPLGGMAQPDHQWMEEFQQWAEEEKEKALKLQEECLRAQFLEALQARERLEAEAIQDEQMNVEVQLKARCAGLREQMEEEKRVEVQEACRRLREEMRREAKMEKEKEMRVIQEQTEERVRECVSTAVQCVREECKKEALRERRALQDIHTEEISQLHNRLQQLQDSLVRVCGERMQYETELKKVQASYRQFIDLTDSSLHSDYLLKLRRLGREPGLMETATQTDEVTDKSSMA